MKPLEAWSIISQDLDELVRMRKMAYPNTKGYSQQEVSAQVITFEALRRMEEDGDSDDE